MPIEKLIALQLGDLLLKNMSLQVEIEELKAALEKLQDNNDSK